MTARISAHHPDLPSRADVVVIGAGVAGLALARELVALGIDDVVVLDRGYPGGGATGRNVARIRAMQLTEPLTLVAQLAQDHYDRMAEELGANVLFYRMGYAWLLYEPGEVERMRPIVEMHRRLGIASRLLGPDDTLRLLPVLRGGEPVLGAVHHGRDAIVHHDAVVWAHLDHLARTRVRVLPGHEVTAVRRAEGRVAGVETAAGVVATGTVVNATDGWSRGVNELAGVRVPNRPIRREVLVTAPLRRTLESAVTFYRPQEGWFNQTLRGEVVMGVVDPDEPFGLEQRSSIGFLRRTARVITAKAPVLADVTVIRQWAGVYDVTPDHQPLVGPTAQLKGWWQANGWSGRGMLLAPLAARHLAAWIAAGADTPATPLLEPFRPDRFPLDADAATADRDYYARYAAKA